MGEGEMEVIDYLDFEEEREISQIRLHGAPNEGRLRDLFRTRDLGNAGLYDPGKRTITSEGVLTLEALGQVTSLLSEFVCSIVLQPMPSAGSVRHFKGDCRPCCFNMRRRCTLGRRCLHCHFPHEKVQRPGKKMRERMRRQELRNSGSVGLATGMAPGLGIASMLEQDRTNFRQPQSNKVAPSPIATYNYYQPNSFEAPRLNTTESTSVAGLIGGVPLLGAGSVQRHLLGSMRMPTPIGPPRRSGGGGFLGGYETSSGPPMSPGSQPNTKLRL